MIQRLRELLIFQGRLTRLAFWRANLLILLLILVVWTIAIFAVMGLGPFASVLFILLAPLLVADLAIAVRRLHDRGKSGWWLILFYLVPAVLGAPMDASGGADASPPFALLALIGFAISLWGFVEIGLLPGTTGANRYGGDPKLAGAAEAFA